jgi:hypothetical protein
MVWRSPYFLKAGAATQAQVKPATRKPMNPEVITTGPRVIMATANASTNWGSVSQWCPCSTPP